jgi:hypothetical protein
MPTLAEFYAPAHRGGAFGILPNSQYYGPTGHRGYDVNGWPAGTQIPAFRAGVVIANYWSAALGWVLVTRDSGRERVGYSHLDEQSPLDVGDRVNLGDPIGPLGNTGKLSAGNHVHLTVSDSSDLPNIGPTQDPWPFISAALSAGSSVASGNKITLPPTDRNEDMETVLRKQTGDIFNLWPAGIKHLSVPNQASISAKVQYENDKWLEVNDADFGDLIDAYCIPRDQVFGAWSNTLPAGHVWSAAGKALATAAEAVRIGNENFKLLNTINAKLK